MATKWMVTDMAVSWDGDVPTFTLTTDVPVHVWAQHSDIPPRTHLRQADDRGLTKLSDPKYCFVEYKETEQEEPADTTEHTIILPEQRACSYRWFLFKAEEAGNPLRSNTAILTYHRKPFDRQPYIQADVSGLIPRRFTRNAPVQAQYWMEIS